MDENSNKIGLRHTFIVAEISANHNQNYQLAKDTIQAAAKAGADAVKFQTFTPDSLSLNIDNEFFGPLKSGLWKGTRPYELYRNASMPWEWQEGLGNYALSLGINWFSSPFDREAVDFLEQINVPIFKIASMEITEIPLIEYVASKGKPVIISTGAADIQDIELALDACYRMDNRNISLLKCTSQYPAPIERANLRTIADMRERFNVRIGLSDHSPGSIVPLVAVSLGATIVEKHFILNRSIGGPDAPFSMEPDEFQHMVEEVRKAEKVLGEVNYDISENDKLRRRSLFAAREIKKGEKLSEQNVRSVRPGHGLHPRFFSEIMGKVAKNDIPAGTPINRDLFA